MAKRRESGFELIASMPWPVGIVLGLIGFVVLRYGVGLFFSSSSNPFLAAFGKDSGTGVVTPFAWLWLGICCVAALASFIARQKRKRLLETQTGLDSLLSMNWREFEMLVGEAFRRKGYSIEETGLGGADGGIDLILRRNGQTTLVQCKQWKTQRVDVKVVREMYGLLAHHGADAVKIVAVGDYTADAQRFAQRKPIELIHGEALLAMVRESQTGKSASRVQPQVSPANAAATAPASTPSCPKCGAQMIRRENRRTKENFWGCVQYPACRGTRMSQ